VKEHNSRRGGHYTRAFGPVKLLWKEAHPHRSSATKREAQIKRLPRTKKLTLIQSGSLGPVLPSRKSPS
jgi:putative endonuclease